MIKFSISEAKKHGFKKLESIAKEELKKHYKGDWAKAIIKADVIDDEIVYEVVH